MPKASLSDTSPAAARVQLELIRRASPARRLQACFSFSKSMIALVTGRGVRRAAILIRRTDACPAHASRCSFMGGPSVPDVPWRFSISGVHRTRTCRVRPVGQVIEADSHQRMPAAWTVVWVVARARTRNRISR